MSEARFDPTATAQPAHPSGQDLRRALGCFATGVTVVTTHWDGKDWGMTCNSFASVSLDPALVLWSIRHRAASFEAFKSSVGYTVNVLSAAQHALAGKFATGPMANRFHAVPVERLDSGRLRLEGAVAWFDCKLERAIEAGDHDIMLGAIEHFGHLDQDALIFTHSRYVRAHFDL